MIAALFSFFGGSVFRMLWGEISHFITQAQDQKQEIERMRVQEEIAAAQHARNLQSMKWQSDLGIKTIEVQSEAKVSELEAEGWVEAVKGTTQKIGIAFVDAWNAIIRPSVATWAIVMITLAEFKIIVLTEFAASIASAALGIYLADRNLAKRGK